MAKTDVTLALLFALTLAAGCKDDPAVTTTGGGGGEGGGGAAGGGGSGGSPEGCTDDPSQAPEGAVCVTEVNGTVVDESGTGITGLEVTVCGAISCNPGESEGAGSFSVEVRSHVVPADYSAIAHARMLNKAGFYFQLPTNSQGPVVDMGELKLLDMPADGDVFVAEQDQMGAPAQSLTSNDVTLDVDAGVFMNIGFDDILIGDDGHEFKARAVPAADLARYVPASLGATLAYAIYPFEAHFRLESDLTQSAKARLSFPNDGTGWAPGTEVEFLALGSYIFPDWVPPATFEVVATGAVSGDGLRIDTAAGEGFEYLTWVAIRETP